MPRADSQEGFLGVHLGIRERELLFRSGLAVEKKGGVPSNYPTPQKRETGTPVYGCKIHTLPKCGRKNATSR